MFDLDACCTADGSNALCNHYLSEKDSFLTAKLIGHHIWINAPFRNLFAFIQHYRLQKAKQPHTTSACILVPLWNIDSPWRKLLHGMKLLHVYPVGTQLFTMPAKNGGRVSMQGIPWPVEVWLDSVGPLPPYVELIQPTASLGQVGGNDGPIMTFDAVINGAQGLVLTDSGATRSFADITLVRENGIILREVNQPVQLADGSTVIVTHECTLTVRIQGFKSTINCLAMDLDQKFMVILGEDWLTEKQALLDYSTKTLRVKKKGKHMQLFPREIEPESETPNPQGFILLNKIQAKRAVRKGYKCFAVNIIDDGVTPVSPPKQADSPHSPAVAALLKKYKIIFKEGGNGLPPERNLGHTIITKPGAKPPYRPMYTVD
jgi:hypothetical protein